MENRRRFLKTAFNSTWKTLSVTLQKFYFFKVCQPTATKQKCKHLEYQLCTLFQNEQLSNHWVLIDAQVSLTGRPSGMPNRRRPPSGKPPRGRPSIRRGLRSQHEVEVRCVQFRRRNPFRWTPWSGGPGLYGKGYPRGKKTAAGRPPCGRATPQTAIRPFGGWPARRAYKGWAWRARVKL
jgi:hypothetical protein